MSYHVIGKHNQKKIGKWKKLKRPKLENNINPSRSLLLIIPEGAWAGGWGSGTNFPRISTSTYGS